MDNAQSATEGAKEAAPEIRTTLLSGVASGIEGLKSLVFFLAFATLSTLFVLKDGPVMHRFINRHMGVPEPVANVVTTNIAKSLRSYFLAVTIIAAFNAHPDRGRGADPRRAARGDDRCRHVRGGLRALRRRVGRRRLRRADRAQHREHVGRS